MTFKIITFRTSSVRPETHSRTSHGSFRARALSQSRMPCQHGYGPTSNKFPEGLAYQRNLFGHFSQGLYAGLGAWSKDKLIKNQIVIISKNGG